MTAYKSGSRFNNCAARSKRDIIDSNGFSSFISRISSTKVVLYMLPIKPSQSCEVYSPALDSYRQNFVHRTTAKALQVQSDILEPELAEMMADHLVTAKLWHAK